MQKHFIVCRPIYFSNSQTFVNLTEIWNVKKLSTFSRLLRVFLDIKENVLKTILFCFHKIPSVERTFATRIVYTSKYRTTFLNRKKLKLKINSIVKLIHSSLRSDFECKTKLLKNTNF